MKESVEYEGSIAFRKSLRMSFVILNDVPASHIHIMSHDIPHAGASGLAETWVPRHRCSVASSGTANPPSAAGSRQEVFSEVLRHKPVNYRVYTTAMAILD